MRKYSVDSSFANSMVSASVESSSDLSSSMRFLGDEGLQLARNAFELFAAALDVGQAMSVGGHHGDGFRLQHHQRAVQGVARFFAGDGKAGLGNHGAQYLGGNLDHAGGGKYRQRGKIRPRHSDHLGVGPSAANADPVILQQLDGDIGVRQQLYVVVQLAGGDGAGAFLLDLGVARRCAGSDRDRWR